MGDLEMTVRLATGPTLFVCRGGEQHSRSQKSQHQREADQEDQGRGGDNGGEGQRETEGHHKPTHYVPDGVYSTPLKTAAVVE